jgi:hypothetical protein
MPPSDIPEGFVRFTQAVVESPTLREWFYRLEGMCDPDRGAWLLDMARHIGGEDQQLAVTAFKLRDPKIYAAVLAAVRERVGQTGDRI